MATSQSRLERVYMQDQATFGTIPNSSGTATLANGDAARHIKVSMENEVALLVRRDKTGSRTATQGVRGRGFARWSFEASLSPSGTPGTAPDHDPLFKAAFGQAAAIGSGTVSVTGATNATPIVITAASHGLASGDCVGISGVGGNTNANGVWIVTVINANTFSLLGSSGNAAYTSGGTVSKVNVKYAFSDTLLSFVLWSFRQPSGLNQRVVNGAAVSELTFNLGADIAEFTASGEGLFDLESNYFSSADATQAGGLSAFPSEPGSPVTTGGIIAGFTGRAVIGGSTIARIRTAQVKINNGSAIVKDTFGSYYGDEIEGDEREVMVSFSMYDTDDASTQAIYNAGVSKTPLDIVLQIGTVSGSIAVLFLKNVQLATNKLDDGQRRFSASIGDSRAFGSSLTARDECTLYFI